MKLKDTVLVLRYSRLARIPVALAQTELLCENGFDVLVFEFGSDHKSEFHASPIPTLRHGCRVTAYLPGAVRAILTWGLSTAHLLRKIISGGRPRFMVAHGLQESVMAYFLKKLTGVSYVVDVHEIYDGSEMRGSNRLFFHFESRALNAAEFLIFPEQGRATLYRERYDLKPPVFTVFNCPRKRPMRPFTRGRADRTHRMIYMGGMGRENCLEAGIDALEYLPSLHFWLVGWGDPEYARALLDRARRKGVDQRLHWLGPTKRRWEYLQAADLSLCLYRPTLLRLRYAATASNKLMESIAAGLPVITLKSGGFPDWVGRRELGVCIDRPEGRQVAIAAERLLSGSDRMTGHYRAQSLHRSQLNYEWQFRSVLPAFKSLVKSGTYGENRSSP